MLHFRLGISCARRASYIACGSAITDDSYKGSTSPPIFGHLEACTLTSFSFGLHKNEKSGQVGV